MKSIVWKEIRENLVWGVLALAAFALGFAYLVRHDMSEIYRYGGYSSYSTGSGGPGISSATFQLAAAAGAAIWGLLLGVLQTLSEKPRDRWAFLIHRPLERSTIFWGKVAGGLSLYFPAIAIPFFGVALWTAWPGHVPAPFDAHLLLAGIADILCGVAFYFAGMWTGLREARWYASRGLAIPAVILVSVFVHLVPEFWQALLVLGCATVLFALAARVSFSSGGLFGGMGAGGKVSSILILTAGAAMLLLLAITIVISLFLEAPARNWDQYQMLKDGTIVRVRYGMDGYPESVVDLHGNKVSAFKDRELWQQELASSAYLRSNYGRSSTDFSYRSFDRYYESFTGSKTEFWFFDRRTRRFLIFSAESRKALGSVGPTGSGSGEAGFAGDVLWHDPWAGLEQKDTAVFSDGVYRLNSGNRTVALIFPAPPGEAIDSAGVLFEYERTKPKLGALVLKIGNKAHVLDEAFKILAVLPLHFDPARDTAVGLYPLSNGQYKLWYVNGFYPPGLQIGTAKKQSPDRIVTLSASGEVLATEELPPLITLSSEAQAGESAWGQAAAMVLVPPGAMMAGVAIKRIADPEAFASALESTEPMFYWGMATCILGGLFAAGVCLVLMRRYRFGPAACAGWAIFVFFAGLPGVIAFIAAHEWPARVQCPACGRRRLVTREQCEWCDAPFPPPVRNGTEIFEPPLA